MNEIGTEIGKKTNCREKHGGVKQTCDFTSEFSPSFEGTSRPGRPGGARDGAAQDEEPERRFSSSEFVLIAVIIYSLLFSI